MENLAGKVAVVTGGGSGIGRGMALAFADAGMNVVLADVDTDAAEAVRGEVEERGARALVVRTDVAERDALETLAEKTFAELGAAHLLCNNAGVTVVGPMHQASDEDWRWVLSVNLEGVIHGIQAFVPRLKRQGQGGHIVNTASMAGHMIAPGLGIYTTTKFAVVGLSESLRVDLGLHGIGVSVLCPGLVKTRIMDAARNRPDRLGGPHPLPPEAGETLDRLGIDPICVGRAVRRAVERNDLYIFTHPEMKHFAELRYRQIVAAFDAAASESAS